MLYIQALAAPMERISSTFGIQLHMIQEETESICSPFPLLEVKASLDDVNDILAAGTGVDNFVVTMTVRVHGNTAHEETAQRALDFIFHINQPFGRYASAQIEMKECRQTTAFLVKYI